MTPAARAAAAIEVLDRILAGTPAEQALVNWGRASRFAGSGDRNALRDLVYTALRCKRSHAALGGAMTGRGLVLGGLRAAGQNPDLIFTGEGHAPAPLGAADAGRNPEGAEARDVQDWLYPLFKKSLGGDVDKVLEAMQRRAPVFLRVNAQKISRDAALSRLAAKGIDARAVDNLKNGLQVISGERKIHTSPSYLEGYVELQDASSQAVVEALPLADGQRVLDYCAGGGGKTLAMAARASLKLFAHDADRARMRDLPARAARAGARMTLLDDVRKSAPYDLILTDVPCSGSGSWRRDPQGKWALTEATLTRVQDVQADILDRVASLVRPGGNLAYATCSLLRQENEDQIEKFLTRSTAWKLEFERRFSPVDGGDGFFLALLTRET